MSRFHARWPSPRLLSVEEHDLIGMDQRTVKTAVRGSPSLQWPVPFRKLASQVGESERHLGHLEEALRQLRDAAAGRVSALDFGFQPAQPGGNVQSHTRRAGRVRLELLFQFGKRLTLAGLA